MQFERLRRFFCPTALVLIVVCLVLFFMLEVYLLALGPTGRDVVLYIQPPYPERVTEYDVGSRNQTRDNLTIAHQLYLKHILQTWGARCNRMHISQGRHSIGSIYQIIYAEHYLDLDWLIHVHVDSYVIMENLRYTLAKYMPTEEIYLRAFHAMYPYAHVGQKNSTDYVLSRGALEQLLARSCFSNAGWQDCLDNMKQGPSELLFPLQIPGEVLPFKLRSEFWNWPYIHRAVYTEQGFNKPLKYPIAFPYTTANQLHVLEYLLYHLRPYGHVNGMPALPEGSAVQLPAVVVDDSVARELYSEVRIICMVLTYPHMYEKVARTIRQTWGRRCNKLIIFSSRNQTNLDGVHTVALNVSEGYSLLWGKTKAAFRHVYRHHRNEADWFFKADDDTYAIIDNMRYMLHSHHKEEPIYFGCHFHPDKDENYMSGGAGYVLSKEALRRLIEHGLHSSGCNRQQSGTEDFEMGVCLNYCGITPADSRDSYGR
ncbi:glycoprotein-N-acetylgalactosamine 3-beta-galactosyltransferase 1, partial [Drosophila albomicans]|uniref:N-acetylgalactosaminide beta-1,3-galactosyltransferase n=1 Tax=Drosophila albomicans TaxID=7291 RepID=A0A9C6SRI4_DROAB